jgi:hypothetical protein
VSYDASGLDLLLPVLLILVVLHVLLIWEVKERAAE